MKSFTATIVVLLVAAPTLSLHAQTVKPASLTIDAVPGYTSPAQDVRFFNTGGTELTLSIAVTGPFAIPTNRCGRGVKPGSHCDVYVTYTPNGIETDSGSLTFTFDNQTVSVTLTGNGIAQIPTKTKLGKNEGYLRVAVSASSQYKKEGYKIPDGDQVFMFCTASDGSESFDNVELKDGVGFWRPSGGQNPWQCAAFYNVQSYGCDYNGVMDAEFACSYGLWQGDIQ